MKARLQPLHNGRFALIYRFLLDPAGVKLLPALPDRPEPGVPTALFYSDYLPGGDGKVRHPKHGFADPILAIIAIPQLLW